jgi:hypothetical protein
MEPLITVEDVARLLKVSPRTVYEHAEEWHGVRVFYRDRLRRRKGYILRFPLNTIRRLMEGGKAIPPPASISSENKPCK